MSDILKQSVSEARAIRKVATEDAADRLAESFKPQMSKMLTEDIKKLTEEGEGMEDEFMDDEEDMDMEDEFMDDEEDMGGGEDMDLEDLIASLSDEEDEGEEDIDSMETEFEEADDLGIDDEIIDFDFEDEDPNEYEDEEELNIDEVIDGVMDEISGDPSSYVWPGRSSDSDERKKYKKQNAKLKEELKTVKKAYVTIREAVRDQFMLNNKLMKSSKILKNHSLTKDDRIKVLKLFDEATTPKEVDMVYKILTEKFSSDGGNSGVSRAIRESADQGNGASGADKFEFEHADRFKKLANLE